MNNKQFRIEFESYINKNVSLHDKHEAWTRIRTPNFVIQDEIVSSVYMLMCDRNGNK